VLALLLILSPRKFVGGENKQQSKHKRAS